MKCIFQICVVVALSISGECSLLAQSPSTYYSVTYVSGNFTCGCSADIGSDEILHQNLYGKPTNVAVTTYCSGQPNKHCTITFPSSDCYSIGDVTWYPTPPVPFGSQPQNLCTSDVISLSVAPAYNSYIWECKIVDALNNVTTKILPNTGSAISVSFQDLFGINNYSGLGSNIYFRYGVPSAGTGCNTTFYSSYSSPYIFKLDQLLVSSANSASAPTCQSGSDGSAIITLNRKLVANESVVQLGFYTSVSFQGHSQPDISNPSVGGVSGKDISVSSLPTGTWFALIQNNLGVCGTESTGNTSVTIPQGPRNSLSASLSITSNYNGAQISCSGSSDGKVTASTNGGGNGSYMYSLDGGGYQASNVFMGVNAGDHSVTVKDGCATPTIASTNTVAMTAPTPTSISAITPSTCNSSNNGQISIAGSGGTGSYTYSLDGGSTYQSSNSFTGLAAPSSYNVRIKDVNNCQSTTGSVNLLGPIIAGSVTPPTCSSGATTMLSISGASGGSGNLKWEIHDASTNALVGSAQPIATSISVSPGVYYAKVIDGNYPTCTASTSNFTVNTPVSGAIGQSSFINCYGQSTAALTVSPSGGTPSYSYSWTNGVTVISTSQSVSSLPAGTYSVKVTDSKGCQNTSPIVVNQPSQLTIGASLSDFNTYNISCKGGSNGSINLTPSGGTPSYTYLWSTGATSQNVSNLAAGDYSVAIKDAKGCNASKNFTLTEPASSVSVSLQSKSDATCFGSNNGLIAVNGSGGVGAISYSKDNWVTFQLNSTFSALPAASFTIYARDINNCRANTPSITINSPTALAIPSIIKSNPLCNGDANGSFTMTASGGTFPYQFSNGGPFASSNSFSGLVAGAYVLSVKDGNGCTISSSTQTLSDPALLVLSPSTISQSCIANVDGSIILTGSGGTSPYTFSIDGGTTFQSTTNFNGLISGIYSSAIKDNHGCVSTKSVGVSIQPQLSGSIVLSEPINCFGQTTGGLSLNVSGGTSPYNYLWSNGSLSQNVSDLSAGGYSVTITDSRNCTTSQSSVVDQPSQLTLSYTNSNYNGFGVSCQNSTDGFINVLPSGGTSPYNYAWTTGATTNTISGIASGNYSVLVTDSKNCIASLPVTLTTPPILNSTVDAITNVTCNGGSDGSITVSASGGVADYMFSLDGIVWQTSTIFPALSAKPYAMQARDGNNCTVTSPVNVTQPSPISINIGTIQDAGCGLSNGSIQSSATGGTGTLNYIWKDSFIQILSSSAALTNAPSGIYSLTVTDESQCVASTSAAISNPDGPVISIVNQIAASCSYSNDGRASVEIKSGPSPHIINWSNGDLGASTTHLSAGNNTVVVTDGNNCTTIQKFTTSSPSAISLNSQQSNSPTCPGGTDGSIKVDATGGIAPYTYTWNWSIGSNEKLGLSPGQYLLTLVDANNCNYSQKIDVVDIPPIVVNVLNQIPPLCSSSADGSVFVKAAGGNGSFSYSWNTSKVGDQLNSVAAGVYTVTATDSKNCVQQKSVSLIAPAPISESLTTSSALCYGGNSGIITVSPTGGIGGYSFSKDNGNTWQLQNVFENLTANNYSIAVKDKNGCSTSSQASINEPPAISITVSKTDPTCDLPNGSAQAIVTGGTGSYKYRWSNYVGQQFDVGPNLNSAPSDVYTLKVADANNCLSSKNVELAAYPSAQFSVTDIVSTSCSYLSDGKARVQIFSAQSPYNISWSNGETATATTGLAAGPNKITIIDANNCKFAKTFQVPSPLPINLISETITNPVCAGGIGSIQVTPSGGTGDFVYRWNGVSGTNTIQNVKAGPYSLTITDGNGCALPKKYELIDPPIFQISLGTDKTICPNSTASIGLMLPRATYQWNGPNNFASTQGNVNVSTPGVYHLTITNSDGCIASDDIAIVISNNLLKADFLTASKAHIGDTLALIDISWPIPDQIEWQFDEAATVIHEDHDYALITFSNTGDFKVGLIATQDGCRDQYYQIVSIDDLPRGGEAKRTTDDLEVSSVVAYPNPFAGKTNTKIELSDSGKIKVKVYSMITNTLIMSHDLQGDRIYNAEIDFEGQQAGVYVIIVESGSKTKAIRVIKL